MKFIDVLYLETSEELSFDSHSNSVIQIAVKWNWGAAIAQWIRLHLPSCRPGFESQAHHLCFFQFKL